MWVKECVLSYFRRLQRVLDCLLKRDTEREREITCEKECIRECEREKERLRMQERKIWSTREREREREREGENERVMQVNAIEEKN